MTSMQILGVWRVEMGPDRHFQDGELQAQLKNCRRDQVWINAIDRHLMKLGEQSIDLDQIVIGYQVKTVPPQRIMRPHQRKHPFNEKVQIGENDKCLCCFFEIHNSTAGDAFLRGSTVVNAGHEELWKAADAAISGFRMHQSIQSTQSRLCDDALQLNMANTTQINY